MGAPIKRATEQHKLQKEKKKQQREKLIIAEWEQNILVHKLRWRKNTSEDWADNGTTVAAAADEAGGRAHTQAIDCK